MSNDNIPDIINEEAAEQWHAEHGDLLESYVEKRAFIAGAKWQKEKDIELNVTSGYKKVLADFFKWFRDNGEKNIGISIEKMIDIYLHEQGIMIIFKVFKEHPVITEQLEGMRQDMNMALEREKDFEQWIQQLHIGLIGASEDITLGNYEEAKKKIQIALQPLTKNRKLSYSETMAELKKLISSYWDSVKCICSVLGRDKCKLNCSEYEQ